MKYGKEHIWGKEIKICSDEVLGVTNDHTLEDIELYRHI